MQVVASSLTASKRSSAVLSEGSLASLETSSLLDDSDSSEEESSLECSYSPNNTSRDTIISGDENTHTNRPLVYRREKKTSLHSSNSVCKKKRLANKMYANSSLDGGERAVLVTESNGKVKSRLEKMDASHSELMKGQKNRQPKYNYILTVRSDSLSAQDGTRSNRGIVKAELNQPTNKRSMHLSTSTPSGFLRSNYARDVHDRSEREITPPLLANKTPTAGISERRAFCIKGKSLNSSECDEELESWRLLATDSLSSHTFSSPWSETPSPSAYNHQRVGSETAVITYRDSLPMMANKADSESHLTTDPPSYTAVTAMTEENGQLPELGRICSASFSANRNSLKYRTRSPSSAGIPRRHSGAANAHHGRITPIPLQQKSSQPQQKVSTCSLTVVSPNSISRSPSQQWNRNSTGNCFGMMPASQAQPTMTSQPTVVQQQPPESAATLNPVDHRNLNPNPLPGAVNNPANPLYNVSNEFMRVAGYSQQFRSLLSKRDPGYKKDGVTFASDTKDKDLERGTSTTPISGLPSNHESNDHSFTSTSVPAAGVTPISFSGVDPTKDPDVDKRIPDPNRPSRKSAYGRLWKEQPNLKQRMKMRKTLFSQRTKVSDFSLLFALAGIILTILEAELTASGVVSKTQYSSYLLRSLVVATTVILIALIICYHAIETKVAVIDSGAEDWRVAITYDRLWQCALEVTVCSVCPFPVNVSVTWDRLKSDHRATDPVPVPLDAVLSVPLFLRFYLFGRFMALHSRQFQDAATRSIAALNHIAVNFTFVLKTLMHEHPLRVLILFTVAFWIAMSWILTQCERYVPAVKQDDTGSMENNHYLNSIWFIIITFMSIGYGDIVPNTYCGRALAITTGIVGAGVSSALIAVISRKLELSRAEKHVNQFMTDSKLTRQRKEAAASVLQHTWFIHKYKNIPKAKDDMKLRMHQRRFLAAINEFRRVKWDQRKLAEQGNALVDVAKLQSDMHETLWDMQQNQDVLVTQMNNLMKKMQELQEIILVHNANSLQQQQQQQQQTVAQSSPSQSVQQQIPRKCANHQFLNRQMTYPNSNTNSIHPIHPSSAPVHLINTPIVIAQHVDNFPDDTPIVQSSLEDDAGGQMVML